ncbi:MAG: hypothetical protein MK102_10430 [Fuerstiella sp.]|nr:hypothetical protein [Fuerstiella sp.]
MNVRITAIVAVCVFCSSGFSEDDSVDVQVTRRQTAVALNYCRAALHRIRRNPNKSVFFEEQQRILNNLNLSKIADSEVISLYRAVLDEISQIEVSKRDRQIIAEQFRQNTQRQLGASFVVIGAQLATGQVGNVIQTGANSWWDYRNQEVRRDADMWNVNRMKLNSVMTHSSTFLDSFWKLRRRNNIPDSWLVSDQDLDQLAMVLREADRERRLRMLQRLERFMTCYPPYWYYVARTQQSMGQLPEAMHTYRRLTEIGSGHFRQDDMLAGSLANMALIQEVRNDPEAPQLALAVSDYSIRNWEANLVSAWVLGRHDQHRAAENLILCNLDDQLETSQSTIALVSLYYHSGDRIRLAKLLRDQRVVSALPIPGLLLCARLLGSDDLPDPASNRLVSSLKAEYRSGIRGAAVVLRAAADWKLQDSHPRIALAGTEYSGTEFRQAAGDVIAEFQLDASDGRRTDYQVDLTLQYPGIPPVRMTLSPAAGVSDGRTSLLSGIGSGSRLRIALEVDVIEVDGVRLSLNDRKQHHGAVKGAAVETPEPVKL